MWFISNASVVFDILSHVVAACAAIAALTPTPTDDGVVAKIRSVVDFFGMNFGFAKNK